MKVFSREEASESGRHVLLNSSCSISELFGVRRVVAPSLGLSWLALSLKIRFFDYVGWGIFIFLF